MTSPDGITWTARSSRWDYPFCNPLNGVAYGNGRFVAVGVAGIVITSVDGLSWAPGPGTSSTRNKIAYGNGTFVAVGHNPSIGLRGSIQISTNGLTWTPEGPTSLDEFSGVVFAGGFVAVGSAGTIMTSPDGVLWTTQQSGTANWLFGIGYGNGRFVAVGNLGTVLTSTNGAAWTSRTSPTLGAYVLMGTGYANGAFVVVGGPIWQSANTTLEGNFATISGYCLSANLGPFSGALPLYGTVTNYATTFDGSTGVPLEDELTNSQFRTSGELRPRTNQIGMYEADYLTRDGNGSLIQYGSFTLNLPVADADTNRVPDVLQADQPGDATIGGTARTDWPVVSSSTIDGGMTRSAGSSSGSYWIQVSALGGSAYYRGTFHLLELAGYVAYSRQPTNIIHFELARADQTGGVVQLTGLSSFAVPTTNALSLPQVTLQGSDGRTYSVLPRNLTRFGNRYSGALTFADGYPLTSWPDYAEWVWTISDQTDTNGNGIPDLTDIFPPKLSISASSTIVTIAWPSSVSGWALESCTNRLAPVWTRVEITPAPVGEEMQVQQPITGGQQFYRLKLIF